VAHLQSFDADADLACAMRQGGRHRGDPLDHSTPVDADKPGGRKQLRRKTMRGMLIMALSTAGQAVLQLVVLALLARAISPAEFGLVSGALLAVFLATALAESGIGQAIIQRDILTRTHLRVGWTLSVFFGVASWVTLALLAPAIEDLLRLPGLTPVLRAVSLIFVIQSLTLSDFLLSRRLQFGRLAVAELASYAVGYGVVAVTMAQLGYGVWAIVWGQIGQSTMRAILVTCMAPFAYRPSFARAPMGQLLNFGAGLTIGRVASWAATQMDNLVVSRYLGAASLGLYGRAYQLVQMPANLFGQMANEVLFPAMSAVQNQTDTLRRIFRLGTGFMAALALPCSLLAAVTSEQLVLVLLGPDWLPLRAAFDVIIFGLLFRTSSKLSDALMKARGAVYRRAWRNIAFAAMVFVGAYAGVPWGLRGVAIGVLVALCLNYLLTSHLCLRLIDMTWPDFLAAHIPALLLSAAAGGTGLVASQLLESAGQPAAIALLGAWTVGVLSCVLLVRLAWRSRLLSPLAGLVVDLHDFLFGGLARAIARLLGPGYAPLLRPEREDEPQPDAIPATFAPAAPTEEITP
jgi:O-antigen/teichoic acid export membrane protein